MRRAIDNTGKFSGTLSFGVQAKILANEPVNRFIQPSPSDRPVGKEVNIIKRELEMMKEYKLKYFDWALDRYAPIHQNSKIYSLSDSEHDFWMRMINRQNGYIRNQTSAEDAERQV